MKFYKIKDISRMTGLSIRALQYYDDIGLLKPNQRSETGYRLYSDQDIMLLQHLVTLKFLGFSLTSIKDILQRPKFETLSLLRLQAAALKEKACQIHAVAELTTYLASQIDAGENINWSSALQIIRILETHQMNKKLEKQYWSNEDQSELGQTSSYDTQYNPDRLFAIPREAKRKEIGIDSINLPFYGFDCWNHYEVSWLNKNGKPMVAIAEIIYDCTTPFLIESKSLKLYFNSFNNAQFTDSEELRTTAERDISKRLGGSVHIKIQSLAEKELSQIHPGPQGICIDELDITCSDYLVNPAFLSVGTDFVNETLYSNILKSNCLVTHQPDWGTVQITYSGLQINKEGLLKYIVSFRNHNEFHEQCMERIFIDILTLCKPEKLTVYGRYTRRGGLDINPYRSTLPVDPKGLNTRLVRQ